MQDTEFYEALLGLNDPWRVTKVELDSSSNRVDVWIEDRSGAKWKCPNVKRKYLYMIIAKKEYGVISIHVSLEHIFILACPV